MVLKIGTECAAMHKPNTLLISGRHHFARMAGTRPECEKTIEALEYAPAEQQSNQIQIRKIGACTLRSSRVFCGYISNQRLSW